jgi:hypothetical protein
MAKTFSLEKFSNSELRKRKSSLLLGMRIPPDAVRASFVRQFLTCGKENCRCHKGRKHGPFNYFVQCLSVGKVRKFLLKTTAGQKQARTSIASYSAFHLQLEELSQINTELLRRGETLLA